MSQPAYPLVYTGPTSKLRARRGAELRTGVRCRKAGKGGAVGGVWIETEDGQRWLTNQRHLKTPDDPRPRSKVTTNANNISTCTCGWTGVALASGGCPVCTFR